MAPKKKKATASRDIQLPPLAVEGGTRRKSSPRAQGLPTGAPLLPPTPAAEEPGVLAVSLGQQYGKKRYYAENKLALTFLRLLKQKSFDPADIDIIKELGYRAVLRPRTLDITDSDL